MPPAPPAPTVWSSARRWRRPTGSTRQIEAALLGDATHGDPADRLIVATAKVHAAPLATKDGKIRASRVLPTLR